MEKVLAVIVLLVTMGCGESAKHKEAREACIDDCPKYSAVYVRVRCAGLACQYECWCRRDGVVEPSFVHAEEPGCTVFDTDHGEVCKTIRHGGEPLRIW